jgi:hypothetical protein
MQSTRFGGSAFLGKEAGGMKQNRQPSLREQPSLFSPLKLNPAEQVLLGETDDIALFDGPASGFVGCSDFGSPVLSSHYTAQCRT